MATLGPPNISSPFDVTKAIGGPSGAAGSVPGLDVPYKTKGIERKVQERIIEERWNQLFRYSFSIAQANSLGQVVNPVPFVPGFETNNIKLRIPPSSISISTQFASNVSATNGGILEENNGVVFRIITIQGSTGVFPDRVVVGQGEKPGFAAALLKNIFPGTVNAIGSVIDSVNAIKEAVVGPGEKELSPKVEEFKNTGYFQFWALHNFFVAYAELKKRTEGQDFRLLFNSPKDNISYVCTPILFDLRRDQTSPLLYRYNITLKAWDLGTPAIAIPVDVLDGVPQPENTSAIKAITNVLTASRQTINSARNVLNGVHSDLNAIMNIYTQGVLVLKDLVGLAEDVADFTDVFSANRNALITGPTNSFVASLNSLFGTNTGSIDEQESPFSSATTSSSIIGAGGELGDTTKKTTTPDGETDVSSKSANQNTAEGQLEQALLNPDFTSKEIDDFDDIPEVVLEQMDDKRDESEELTSGDIRDLSVDLQEVSDNFGESFGGADAVYSAAKGLPAPIDTDREPSEDDIINQVALQEAVCSFRASLGTGQIFTEQESDPYVQSNLNLDIEDQMPSPLSAIPIPFERGSTLERMAQKFLGDPNRAREIAILNNLRPPFIDETGFTKTIDGANGRSFVTEEDDRIVINQVIVLKGTGVSNSRRRILNIQSIGGTQIRIIVDGPDNLSIFAPGTNPFLDTRLPGSVGAGDTILIPNPTSPDEPVLIRQNSILERLTFAEKIFKIDLALDAEGKDLVVSPNGDVARSFGYDNALQALRLAVDDM